jgi:hypothetical protein
MDNPFSRSWEITKLSFGVIKHDKELLLFPILAIIFSLIFIIVVLFPSVLAGIITINKDEIGLLGYIILFILYAGLAFISTFFNVAVVYTAKKRFEGGNALFRESVGFALSKLHLIFYWSLVSATVGIILRIIENFAERSQGAGRILLYLTSSLFGMVWAIATLFVIPGMVYYNLGPIAAIKKSIAVLKKTWGESLIRYYGLGLAQFLFIVIGIVFLIPLYFIFSILGLFGIFTLIAIGILYFLIVVLVFGIANQIFNTALFVYADSGKIPGGYNEQVMRNAFTKKRTLRKGIV